MPTGLLPYVIDFVGATMNTTLATDKRIPPVFTEISNFEITSQGTLRKRTGFQNISTNASPDVPETRVNAIVPVVIHDFSTTLNWNLVLGDTKIYESTIGLRNGAWNDMGLTLTDGIPYVISWGQDDAAANNYCAFICNGGVWLIGQPGLSVATKLGSASDASNPWSTAICAEYFLNKLWVGATVETQNYPNRLRWSVTGDPNDFYSAGSGQLNLEFTGTGGWSAGTLVQAAIQGLRVYRNRLYIFTDVSIIVLTGTTSDTFGTEYITQAKNVNGATIYQAGDYLYYVDRHGIWQFDGNSNLNLSMRDMKTRWETLSFSEIDSASASWDDYEGIYRVYFPTAKEEWNYYYRTGQWAVRTFFSTDSIRCISAPTNSYGNKSTAYCLGAATNGGAFITNDTVLTDDGNAITASFTTGHIRLGEMNGGRPGNRFRLHYIDIEAARQDTAGVLKVTLTVDGAAQTQASLTTADAGASAETFPTSYDGVDSNARIDLGTIQLVGKYIQIKAEDDDADSRGDLRRMVLWYEPLEV